MSHKSYWAATQTRPRFARLENDLNVDVVVIGGGITGITAAYLLNKAGLSVALLERDRCVDGDTVHTTAHLTFVTDLRLHELVSRFGRDHAQATWDAGQAALDQIDEIVREEDLDCDFAWVPGYLHAPSTDLSSTDADRLQRDAQLAQELGFEAEYLESVPLMSTAGVCFSAQARFHPLKYLSGLLQQLPGETCHIFESSEVSEVQDDPLQVKANGHSVSCNYIVIATHVPLQGKAGLGSAALFQSKLASYSSYAIGAKLPKETVPEALFWDTADPYHYLRVDRHPRHDYVIYGGEDHKTGQEENPEHRFRQLERSLSSRLPEAVVNHQWSGQVIETNDGLPLMGELSERQFIATGFAGNGMTFGTLAAMMACDSALGKKNPWEALFDVHRKKILGGAWNYIKENLDYPYYMIKDRFSSAEGKTLRGLRRGTGKILDLKNQRVAVYRDSQGRTTTLAPACTHLGCVVTWNRAESTWDCPCHGSRFHPTGEVLAGPAETPLKKISLEESP